MKKQIAKQATADKTEIERPRTKVVELPIETAVAPQPSAKDVTVPKESIHFASLPLVSCMDQGDMDEAKRLLEEYDNADALIKQLEGEKDGLKKRLNELQETYGLQGMRWGGWAYANRTMDGRETLSKELLIQAGVGADVIKACTVRGRPYQTGNFKRLTSAE